MKFRMWLKDMQNKTILSRGEIIVKNGDGTYAETHN